MLTREITIANGNELIARFMGFTDDQIQNEEWCGCNVLINQNPSFMDEEFTMVEARYHSSWDWLMPALRLIKYGNPETGRTYITPTEISHESNRRYKAIENSLRNLSIEQTWFCVVKFIQWHNQTTQ